MLMKFLNYKKIRITTVIENKNSCQELFKNLKILTVISQYVFSVVCFLTDRGDEYVGL